MNHGTLLTFDLQGCKKGLSAPQVLYQILGELADKLKLERLVGPQLASYIETPANAAGEYTLSHCGVLMGECGHITIRTFPEDKVCLLDIFSTLRVDDAIVLASIKLYFEPDCCDCDDHARGEFKS